jgi:mono/diheme cytochrome c family protein
MIRSQVFIALAVLTVAAAGVAGEPTETPKRQPEQVRRFLTAHCLSCHGAEKPKGGFRLDQLDSDFSNASIRERWQAVADRVASGEMPPDTKPKPAKAEVRAVSEWIQNGMQHAAATRRAQGRTVLRRLNRIEYENTVRDLLGIDADLRDLLPPDSAADGFDNVGEALHTSTFLLEKYLEAAEKSLDLAIANRPRPPLIKKRYSLKDERHVKQTTERVFRIRDDGGVAMFSSSPWQAIHLFQFYPPDRGRYRFRIAASAVQSEGKPVSYRVDAGSMLMAGKNHLVSYFDAPAEKVGVVEFVEHLESRSTIRILPYGLASAQTVNKIGADEYTGQGIVVHYVEVEGPLHDEWPPASHRRLFGEMAQKPAPVYDQRDRVEVVSEQPEIDAERILRAFARRAFRRETKDADVKPFLSLVKGRLAEKYSFERAIRVGLAAMMVSPDFLFLRERSGKLDDFALANRLSYFLWSTMPDEELLSLAERRKLTDSETLRRQVDRLLKDPRASALSENFVGQWLGLRDIDATTPSHILYPEYDEMLKFSMLKETYLFFEELLKHDLSVTHVVSSDFSMINGRLARHYGIPGIEGWEFRKAALPEGSHRGGFLTMASVLKVTANGTYTSPILRGAWVLDRILGTPPPRPPEGVSAVEPDIRGATTIREQLAKHRQVASCAICHVKIDPPGFALESFDVIGGWRDDYRATGNGKAVMIGGRRMPYLLGKKVDPADELPDGRRFANIDEYRKLLLNEHEQIARALTRRLTTYATGAATHPSDQAEIDAIVRKMHDRQGGLRTLVHEIVQSDLFRTK